jgi:hypothetical protein
VWPGGAAGTAVTATAQPGHPSHARNSQDASSSGERGAANFGLGHLCTGTAGTRGQRPQTRMDAGFRCPRRLKSCPRRVRATGTTLSGGVRRRWRLACRCTASTSRIGPCYCRATGRMPMHTQTRTSRRRSAAAPSDFRIRCLCTGTAGTRGQRPTTRMDAGFSCPRCQESCPRRVRATGTTLSVGVHERCSVAGATSVHGLHAATRGGSWRPPTVPSARYATSSAATSGSRPPRGKDGPVGPVALSFDFRHLCTGTAGTRGQRPQTRMDA